MHLFKFEVDDGSGDPVYMPCVLFGPDAIYAAERVKPGHYIRLEGYTKHDESWGASFQVTKIVEIRSDKQAA
jgi:single-stranded DNA-binding protein